MSQIQAILACSWDILGHGRRVTPLPRKARKAVEIVRRSCIDLKDIFDLVFFEIIDINYIINKIFKFKEKTRFDLMYM